MKTGNSGGGEDGRSDRRDEPGQSDKSGSEHDDNVVQLPIDWLGPREDLVPFGPSAVPDPPDIEQAESGDGQGKGEGAPVSPDDFWGERSAALHDTLEQREEAKRRSVLVGAWSRLASARFRRPAVAMGIAALIAVAVVGSLSLIGGTGSPGGSTVASSAGPSHGAATWPWHAIRKPSAARPRTRAAQRTKAARHSSGTRGAKASRRGHSSSGSTSAFRTYVVASSQPSTPPASTPPPSSTSPPTSPSTSPTTVSDQRKSSTPAFGARGALGPGSSPTH